MYQSITKLFSESQAWQLSVLTYFLLGALAVIILWFKRGSQSNTFANDVSAILNRRLELEMSPWERFVDKKLIPAMALSFAWLFWPFIVMGRIWVAWRH